MQTSDYIFNVAYLQNLQVKKPIKQEYIKLDQVQIKESSNNLINKNNS